MSSFAGDFQDMGDVVWLNAASEGPLPRVARAALEEAVEWKSAVHRLDIPKFIRVPKELKESIADLLCVDPADVFLGNSASYGLHLLADGLPWEPGDDIVLMQNDFPTDILPWLALEDRGVSVRQVKPAGWVLTPEEVKDALRPETKLLCLSHVHTFSGHILDAAAIADICRQRGVVFVLNVVQSLGNRPVDVPALGPDAVVAVGYKWLCGPYGTGFGWMRPELRGRLRLNRAYWSAYLTAADLESEGPIVRKERETARTLDVFGTANFFNFVPLKAALDYWRGLTIPAVQSHNLALIEELLAGLNRNQYEIISPQAPDERSNLAVISRHDRANAALHKWLLHKQIYTALWKGRIRIAPHVYNSPAQITRVVALLNEFKM